jgi:outer membrane receptor protein involved in Fe transport
MNTRTTFWIGFVCAMGATYGAWAQVTPAGSTQVSAADVTDGEQLAEIVVTAERRESSVQKTAASVSVRSGAELEYQGKFTTAQILEDVPGVTYTPSNSPFTAGTDTAGANITIRGLASNATAAGQVLPTVPSTAVYTDGVYEGVGGNYDIERVEVLRGPQGTLYGRSATSGVVSVYTRDPVLDHFQADILAETGNYDLQHYSGAVNLPAGDTFAIRIAANEYKRNGYYSEDGGATASTDGRIKMLYKPNDDLSLLVGAAFEDNTVHTGGTSGDVVAPQRFIYVATPVEAGKNSFRQYWANLNWDFGPAALTYLPAFRKWYQNADIYAAGPGGSGLFQPIQTPYDEFVTHELRLTSAPASKLTWLLGGFFYDNHLRDSTSVYWFSSLADLNEAQAQKETKDEGIFAEATYPLTSALRATAGLRYDYTYVHTDEAYTSNLNEFCNTPLFFESPVSPGCAPGQYNSPLSGTPENNSTLTLTGNEGVRRFYNLTYKARLEYDLAPANLIYGMVSSGFLPGDVQAVTGAGGQPAASPYAEETLTAYEIGSKNRFLNQKLQVNGDIFYYNYGGYQASVAVNPLNPTSSVLLTVPMRMEGGELEILYRITEHDQIELNGSSSDAYFVHAPATFSSAVSQSHLWNVVPHSASAAYSHSFVLPGGSTIASRIDSRFQSAHDINSLSTAFAAAGGAPYVHVGGAFVTDINGTWTNDGGRFSVTAYARNIADKRYMTFILLQSVTPLSASGTQYDPRTFGVVLAAHF